MHYLPTEGCVHLLPCIMARMSRRAWLVVSELWARCFYVGGACMRHSRSACNGHPHYHGGSCLGHAVTRTERSMPSPSPPEKCLVAAMPRRGEQAALLSMPFFPTRAPPRLPCRSRSASCSRNRGCLPRPRARPSPPRPNGPRLFVVSFQVARKPPGFGFVYMDSPHDAR